VLFAVVLEVFWKPQTLWKRVGEVLKAVILAVLIIHVSEKCERRKMRMRWAIAAK
jgi:branched-subunit amino acid permease